MKVTIYETKEYGIFKVASFNRDLRDARKLEQSILDVNLCMFNPIIVDENMTIIDGHHRFKICKDNNLPVYYVIVPREYCSAEKAMILLNKNQKVWSQGDYVKFWAKKKGGCYSSLLEFRRKSGLDQSQCNRIFGKIVLTSAILNNGKDFEINEKAWDIVLFLKSEEVQFLDFCRTTTFVASVRNAFDKYTKSQMERIKKRIIAVPRMGTQEQYMNCFDNLLKKIHH